jgi:hypothetical protein
MNMEQGMPKGEYSLSLTALREPGGIFVSVTEQKWLAKLNTTKT